MEHPSTGGYIVIGTGYCEDIGNKCHKISGPGECEYAAKEELGLNFLLAVQQAVKQETPAGCYVRPEWNTLWFNQYSRAPASKGREVICRCEAYGGAFYESAYVEKDTPEMETTQIIPKVDE
eukprot:gb/GEZN01014223.1/.p1 GENE.gb/GEZN01014223.1/~~gb/GEZN01014223.1/.p1  ORF type:complete len:122 (-),score=20.47 gb/GEZN01014223.1/:447-812(-)